MSLYKPWGDVFKWFNAAGLQISLWMTETFDERSGAPRLSASLCSANGANASLEMWTQTSTKPLSHKNIILVSVYGNY